MRHLFFGLTYVIRHHLSRKRSPLICGLVLNDSCNLNCRHCRLANRGEPDLSFEQATPALDSFYRKGGRTLYIEGGGPFIWRDGRRSLQDVVEYARGIGFLSVVVYTNGTKPLETTANTLFVSVDGLQPTHDYLRGRSFHRIMDNIRESRHRSLYVNYTINRCNKDEIEAFCEYTTAIPQIRGIFFYFHTPYYDRDDLYIEPDERRKILRALLAHRKRYRILNSQAGLKSALANDWARPLDICYVDEHDHVYECCRYPGDPDLCENCGYLSYAEIDQVLKLKPSAIRSALKYF
jgi:MoaA/NifB/PqqE/SkfB family radical SAM enzyme